MTENYNDITKTEQFLDIFILYINFIKTLVWEVHTKINIQLFNVFVFDLILGVLPVITWPGVLFLPVETELREAVLAGAPGLYSPLYKQRPGHYTTPETYKHFNVLTITLWINQKDHKQVLATDKYFPVEFPLI